MQGDLFLSAERKRYLPMQDGEVYVIDDFLDHRQATLLFEHCQQQLQWRQDNIKLFGKVVKIPRLQAWHGDKAAQYRYSGLDLTPSSWTEALLAVKALCEEEAQSDFNAVLANWYRDGSDSMGFHADDEPELGPVPVIATVTLGETRALQFKHKELGQKLSVGLPNGSLLVMQGKTQRNWQHGLPKTKAALGSRISLTFRQIMTAA